MTIRDATRRSGPTNTLVRKQATATDRVLTGALRSRLSLKYRRQFGGWFGCPIHLYHHRSVTYGFSSLLFSSLHSALYSSPLSILPILPRVLSYDLSYSEFPFRCPPASAPLFGHQPNSTLCSLPSYPTPSHHHHLPPTNRAPAKSNPTYSFWDLISLFG